MSGVNVFATETTGVISTIQPINSLVSAVIGNTGKSITIIPSEQSPHDFKLKPSDVKVLQNGNIIFYVSNHLESSITKVFKNLPKNIKLINLMEESGINHLAIRDNDAWERHDHHGMMITMTMINTVKNMMIMMTMKKKTTCIFG